jgi:hypothetical protein
MHSVKKMFKVVAFCGDNICLPVHLLGLKFCLKEYSVNINDISYCIGESIYWMFTSCNYK